MQSTITATFISVTRYAQHCLGNKFYSLHAQHFVLAELQLCSARSTRTDTRISPTARLVKSLSIATIQCNPSFIQSRLWMFDANDIWHIITFLAQEPSYRNICSIDMLEYFLEKNDPAVQEVTELLSRYEQPYQVTLHSGKFALAFAQVLYASWS